MKQLEAYINKYGIKKIYLITAVFLLFIGITISLIVDSYHKKFEIDGVLYQYDSVVDHVWTFTDSKGQALSVHTENYQYSLDSDTALLLTYGDQRIKQTADFQNFASSIYNNDVLVYEGELMSLELEMIINGEINDPINASIPFEKKLIIEVLRVAEHVQSGVLINFIILNLFLITLGTGQVFFPLSFWQLKHMFDVKGGEPTDFYMHFTRIGGGVLTGIGVFFPLYYLFL